MKEKFRDLLGGFILAILLFLSAGLFLHVFIEPIYLEQGKSSSLTQDIQNIISFLSFCATAAIGWLAYEIQKKQKKFNENQAELENTRAKRQLEFNEKSLTDYQRDFLRKSFREFCFYHELISKIDYQISSLDQNERNDYDVSFCLAQRIYQWITPQPIGKSAFEILKLDSYTNGIAEGTGKVLESRPDLQFSTSGANYQIFNILHDKVLEIEVMAFQDSSKEVNQKEKYKEIPRLWSKYILEKFEFTERVIFDTIQELEKIIASKNNKISGEFLKDIAGLVQGKLLNNSIYMKGDGDAKKEAKELYQKYLSNRHINEDNKEKVDKNI